MSECIICKQEVIWNDVVEEFESLFEQIDRHGVESLTEDQQLVYEGKICSYKCFIKQIFLSCLPFGEPERHKPYERR